MLGVRGVSREQHVMTGAFLDWAAFQLSGQRSSALTHSPKTPGGLLLEAEGHRNTTHNVHRPLLRRLGLRLWYESARNLSLTSNQTFKSLITLSSWRSKPKTKWRGAGKTEMWSNLPIMNSSARCQTILRNPLMTRILRWAFQTYFEVLFRKTRAAKCKPLRCHPCWMAALYSGPLSFRRYNWIVSRNSVQIKIGHTWWFSVAFLMMQAANEPLQRAAL